MAIALVQSVWKGSTGGATVTTDAADFTGCDLIVVGHTSFSPNTENTLSDSQGNTWTALTVQQSDAVRFHLYYAAAPSVSSTQTFSLSSVTSSFPALAVVGFSGTHASPFDVSNGAVDNTGDNSMQPGSVTPSQNDSLVVTGIGCGTSTVPTMDGGFTVEEASATVGGNHFGIGLAYLIQTSAAAANPTWSYTATAGGQGSTIAVFKPAVAAAGHPTMRRWGGVPFVGGQGIGQKGSAGNSGRAWGRRKSGIIVPQRFREAA